VSRNGCSVLLYAYRLRADAAMLIDYRILMLIAFRADPTSRRPSGRNRVIRQRNFVETCSVACLLCGDNRQFTARLPLEFWLLASELVVAIEAAKWARSGPVPLGNSLAHQEAASGLILQN